MDDATGELVKAVREVATEQVERELRELRENLSSVQRRSTEQATEIRALKMAGAALCAPEDWKEAVENAHTLLKEGR